MFKDLGKSDIWYKHVYKKVQKYYLEGGIQLNNMRNNLPPGKKKSSHSRNDRMSIVWVDCLHKPVTLVRVPYLCPPIRSTRCITCWEEQLLCTWPKTWALCTDSFASSRRNDLPIRCCGRHMILSCGIQLWTGDPPQLCWQIKTDAYTRQYRCASSTVFI